MIRKRQRPAAQETTDEYGGDDIPANPSEPCCGKR